MSDPTRTIVVGYDASPEADAALTWAQSVAGDGDTILVMGVWQLPVSLGYGVIVAFDADEIESSTRRLVESTVADRDDPRLRARVEHGHAGQAIVDAAADADIVVVGHRGSGRMSMLLGSTANYVVHHTQRPAVVVRGDGDVTAPRSVVVGVDDFDDDADNPSVRALRWAMDLPGVERVTALHSWVLPPIAVGVLGDVSCDLADLDRRALAVAERVIAAAGAPPDGVVVDATSGRGSAGERLVDASRSVDLVVVGRRGRGGFSELVLGSTSATVVAHGRSPIALVR